MTREALGPDLQVDLLAYADKLATVTLGYPDGHQWAEGYKAGQADAAGGLRARLKKAAPLAPPGLRDEIAIAALPLVAPRHSSPHANVVTVLPEYYGDLAADAYALADAMLKARAHG